MPKLRVPLDEHENRLILAKIEYLKKIHSVTNKDLSVALRMTPRTYYNRLISPEDFSIRELRLLSKKLHVPITEFLTESQI
jgi:hypothetical protein